MTQKSDVLVVGGGIIGLTLSLSLLEKGLSVTCIEKNTVGAGCSNASLGIVYPISPLTAPPHVVKLSVRAFELYQTYLEHLATITGEKVPVTDTGVMQIAFNENEINEIERTVEAYKTINVNIQRLTGEDIRKSEPLLTPQVQMGTYFPNAFHVYCRELIGILAKAVRINKGKIYEDVAANNLIIKDHRCQGITTDDQTYEADIVILCGGAWSLLFEALPFGIDRVMTPVRGQCLLLRAKSPLVNRLIYTADLDIVPRKNGEILVGSTVEHAGYNSYPTPEGVHFLLDRFLYTIPTASNIEFCNVWTGLRPKTIDELPAIGTIPNIKGLHISTGHYKNGIYLGPLTSSLHADWIIQDKAPEDLLPLSPSRLFSF